LLDDFTDKSLRELKPPDIKKGHLHREGLHRVGDIRRGAPCGASADGINRSRARRSGGGGLLTRTESYARTEQLLEIDY